MNVLHNLKNKISLTFPTPKTKKDNTDWTRKSRNLGEALIDIEPDMEKKTGSKLGKEYIKAVHYHPAYLTYMQSTSCEIPDCMKH